MPGVITSQIPAPLPPEHIDLVSAGAVPLPVPVGKGLAIAQVAPLLSLSPVLPIAAQDQAQILRNLYAIQCRYAPLLRSDALAVGQPRFNNDVAGMKEKIIKWVMKRMRYVADPVGTEYVVMPDALLNQIKATGIAHGDCDDHVVLLNTLLNAVGIEAYPVGVKLNGSPIYNHVVTGFPPMAPGGEWTTVDPCVKNQAQPFYREKLVL